MMDLEFSFGQSPWEAMLDSIQLGDAVSAVNLLAMLESEDEETFEEAMEAVCSRQIHIDMAQLPKAMLSGESAERLRREELLARNGLRAQDLTDGDPLKLYLEEVASTPAAGDERILAEQASAGSESAMNALTNLGLGRVVELACNYVGYGVLLLDLIQEGSLGLWQAITEYSGGDYAAQRDIRIAGSMAKAVLQHYRSTGIGQKMRQAMEDYRSVDERLLTELGRNATLEEIAQQLHMTPEDAGTVKKMLDDARMIQQAKAEQEPDEPSAEDEQAVEDTAYFQARQRILELLSVLSEEDARLLTLRFGLEKGMPLSPQETAERLGITPDEVVAREAAALAKLRSEK